MIILIIHVIISFLLDGLLSNYISTNIINPSYFRTIYSIVSLVVIFSYFEDNKKYLYILFIVGALFDIVYTNTFILNIVIFLLIYMIINILNNYIPNNIFTINIKSLLAIATYHILSFLILSLANYHIYSINALGIILYRSIIMTIIYTSISYLILRKVYYKIYDKKVK